MGIIKPYQIGDRARCEDVIEELTLIEEEIFAANPGYTLYDGDTVLACGGVIVYPNGIGRVWLVLSSGITNAGFIGIIKKGAKLFTEIARKNNLSSLEAVIQPNFYAGQRFAERFGFRLVGKLPGYGCDGSDQLLYFKEVA